MGKHQTKEADDYISLLHDLTFESANKCIQCGYCLPVCPTYKTMGNEAQSPRGRINLVKLAAEGKINIQKDLAESIDLCLGCRACEVACPVNVPYGEIYEGALEVINKEKQVINNQKDEKKDKLLNATLTKLFPYKKRLRTIGNFTWFYQNSGLGKVVRKTKIINRISKPLGQFEKVLPTIEKPRTRYKFGKLFKATGEKKLTVAFFPGCIMDAVMSKINRLTIELLQKCGCDVFIPDTATCCGALHAHQGKVEEARELAKQNIQAFEELNVLYVINNAGGCGAMLYEYDKLLSGEKEWYEKAKSFVKKSKDVHEVLNQIGPLPYTKSWKGLITYQDSCHLRNVQGVIEEPRALLNSIPGATFIEMNNSDLCCASGGIYNLMHFNESMDILDEKMVDVINTKAKTLVTTNPGCLLQMKLGVDRNEHAGDIEVLHLIEVLAMTCGIE